MASPGLSYSAYSGVRVGPPRMKDFILSEKLGEGTYASVYKGFRKGGTREVVAVKCITRDSLSKSSSENLLREIEILKGIDHEHVVKLKDFQWNKDNVFLILEYCSGGDLSMYIARYKRLSERIARKFLRQLALALEFLQSKNIVHMDLKPQNLLLQSKENPILKVADFGFAQRLLGKEGRDNLRGSPLYMAVEMFLSDSYDASVDLWSVGCILHEALFGFAPFASSTFEELELKILSRDPIIIPNHPPLSPECHDLLTRLLQRDPSSRISFDEFFAHSFIDLEHAPCSTCITKAVELVTKAVKCDSDGEEREALTFYCASLEYFLPAIEYEKVESNKVAIRNKVKQYICRAEQLKAALIGQETQKARRNDKPTMECFVKDHPNLEEAKHHRELGDNYDLERQFGHAMREYQKALDMYLSVMSKTKLEQLKVLLKEEVRMLSRRLDELSRYRELLAIDEDPTVGSNSLANNRCIIQ